MPKIRTSQGLYDKDKDQIHKDKDKDKDLKLVLKESLRTRTRTRINITGVNKDDFFQLNNVSTRCHPYKLYKPFSHCTTRTSFFSIRILNVWNDLPADIVDFRSLQSFKGDMQRYITKFMKSGF